MPKIASCIVSVAELEYAHREIVCEMYTTGKYGAGHSMEMASDMLFELLFDPIVYAPRFR